MHSIGHLILTFGAYFTSFVRISSLHIHSRLGLPHMVLSLNHIKFHLDLLSPMLVWSSSVLMTSTSCWNTLLEVLLVQIASFKIIIGTLGRKYIFLQRGKYLLIFKFPIIGLIGSLWNIMFMFFVWSKYFGFSFMYMFIREIFPKWFSCFTLVYGQGDCKEWP